MLPKYECQAIISNNADLIRSIFRKRHKSTDIDLIDFGKWGEVAVITFNILKNIYN